MLLSDIQQQNGDFTSPWTCGESVLLPQLVPLPDAAPRLRRKPVAQLMRQHQDLAAVMGLVREHVGEHAGAGGPGARPASAREFLIFRSGSADNASVSIRRHCSRSGYALPRPASWCSGRDRGEPGTSSAGLSSSAIPAGCCAGGRKWRRWCGRPWDSFRATARAMLAGRDARAAAGSWSLTA